MNDCGRIDRNTLLHGADCLKRQRDCGVILETATPAEITARGAGLTLQAGIAVSPFGHCLIARCPRGIRHLSFFNERGREIAAAEMRAAWPLAEVLWNDRAAADLMHEIFHGEPGTGDALTLRIRGTPFQLRVWRALLRVPPGAVVSYGNLAAAAGNPNAARATGRAVGANPVAFLIPCHRVVRADGDSGHYRWGAARKRAMLAWEMAR
jgi:AraC family transcriptional regulator of adaptative response/methylated-DNA-[protein]-cysteine methyltransferase